MGLIEGRLGIFAWFWRVQEAISKRVCGLVKIDFVRSAAVVMSRGQLGMFNVFVAFGSFGGCWQWCDHDILVTPSKYHSLMWSDIGEPSSIRWRTKSIAQASAFQGPRCSARTIKLTVTLKVSMPLGAPVLVCSGCVFAGVLTGQANRICKPRFWPAPTPFGEVY